MSSSTQINNEFFMQEALKEAKKAYEANETPIGAVITYNNEIIARGSNLRETLEDSTAHAEMNAIREACHKHKSWRLEDCTLYVTLEPCVMCAGAIIQSRIKRVVYGAKNKRFGAHQGAINLFSVPFNHQVEVIDGILEEECSKLISAFFINLRKGK